MFNIRKYSRIIMYKCEICGREIFKKHSLFGYSCLCRKHMHQLLKYGKFLDNNHRTNHDLNEIHLFKDHAIIDLYDRTTSDKVGECIIDIDDYDKVKYKKWRLSRMRVLTGLPCKGTQRDISRVILDSVKDDEVVDHINGNTLDNRKSNLRICKQCDNTLNKHRMSLNTSGIIGVCPDKRKGRAGWVAEIRKQNTKLYLGSYHNIEEAAYARYCAEVELFKEFRNTNNDEYKFELFKNVPQNIKTSINTKIIEKIHKKFKCV